MKISITTTPEKMVVADLETGQSLAWVDEVSIGYDPCSRRTKTYLATCSDSTISVVSEPPPDFPPTPTPTPTPEPTA